MNPEIFKRFIETKERSRRGEVNTMETKSRYEVIAELESKKRELIRERDSFPDKIRQKEKEIKMLERDIEDAREELEDYRSKVEERQETIKELIESVESSLLRFELSKSQKK